MQYLVTVPNPKYNGRSAGIQFTDGRALISTEMLNPALGKSLEQVARELRDLGYAVEPLGAEAPAAQRDERPALPRGGGSRSARRRPSARRPKAPPGGKEPHAKAS